MYTLRRKVHFYETDGMKVAHHANYFKWFEEARVEYMRAGGLSLNDLMDQGVVFPIMEVSAKYLLPAQYDDYLLIRTYLREVDRAKLVFEYEVYRESDGALLTVGRSLNTYTKIDTGRIARMPKAQLEQFMEISREDRENG